MAEKEKDKQFGKDINNMILSGYGVAAAQIPIDLKLSRSLSKIKTDLTKDELRNVVKDFSKSKKVKVVYTDIGENIRGANMMHPKYYKEIINAKDVPKSLNKEKLKTALNRKAFVANLPRNEAVALHELGHVNDFRKANFNKSVPLKKSVSIIKGTPYLMTAPLVSGRVRNSIRKVDLGIKAGDKTMDFVEKHPFISAAAIMGAPTLYREGKASGYAIGQLVKKHGLKQGLSKGKVLAPAFASYIAKASRKSIPIGMGIGVNKAIEDKNKRKSNNETFQMSKQAWIIKNKERGLYDKSYKELNNLISQNPNLNKTDGFKAIYREWNNHPLKEKAVNEFMIGNRGFEDRFKQRNTLKQSKGSVKAIDNDIALRIKNLKNQEDINNFIKGVDLGNN